MLTEHTTITLFYSTDNFPMISISYLVTGKVPMLPPIIASYPIVRAASAWTDSRLSYKGVLT